MPIYLVRWPDLAAALVGARDEDELLETLDRYPVGELGEPRR